MSLIFTDDQKSLAETVRRFVAQRTPLPKVREVIGGDQAYDQEVWSRLAGDLGLAYLTIPEEYGGAGATQADLSAALRELGAGLVPSPLLACVLTARAPCSPWTTRRPNGRCCRGSPRAPSSARSPSASRGTAGGSPRSRRPRRPAPATRSPCPAPRWRC
ncbi:acyl-CoA dehydrogenase family protein [Nonomuraea ferruginea]